MCLMSPAQLRNKFPWINTEGVALASYGEACLQRGPGVLGHFRFKVSAPHSQVKEDCFPPGQQGLPGPCQLSVPTLVSLVTLTSPSS